MADPFLLKVNDILTKLQTTPSEEIESENIEFKGYEKIDKDKYKSIAKAVSAFSNKSGGIVIIGVKDSKHIRNKDWHTQIKGIDVIDESKVAVNIKGKLRPAVDLNVTNFSYEERNFIIVEVFHRLDTLVSTSDGNYYIRDGSKSRPMEPYEIENAVRMLRKYDWSQDIIDDVDIKDSLDTDSLESAIEEYSNLQDFSFASTQEVFLDSVGITINGKITKGGLLFLGTKESIQKYIGNIEYRVSRKTRGGDLPINKIWTGSLWEAIKQTRELFDKIVDYRQVKYKRKKFTVPTIDKIAFDEAFINSLVHRDYTKDGMITVDFLEDTVLITSPGSFYDGITEDNIYSHPPRHRNKALSSIFMNFELVERAGMGVQRMTIHSLKYGRRKPVFHDRNNSVQIVLSSYFVKEDVFALTSAYENYGVPELLIINFLCDNGGVVSVSSMVDKVKVISNTPWEHIRDVVERIDFIELVGDKNNQIIRFSKKKRLFYTIKQKLISLWISARPTNF